MFFPLLAKPVELPPDKRSAQKSIEP